MVALTSVPQCLSESSLNRIQPKRLVKSEKNVTATQVDWIKCDTCKHWLHTQCCGLSSTDFKKLTTANQFFKCVLCCLKLLPSYTRAELLQPTVASVVPQLCDISQIDLREPNLSVLSYSDNQTPSAGINNKSANSQPWQCNTITECNKDAQQLFNNNVGPVNVYSEDSERDNIVIIDYIPNSVEFINSSRILKEINNFAPSVSVKYAYSLARGGVAIHLNNQQDKEKLLQALPSEAFGGGKVYDLSSKVHTAFVKGVASSVTTSRIRELLAGRGIDVLQLERLTQRGTGRPLPVVKVSSKYQAHKQLCSLSEININGIVCKIQKKHIDVYRCYNCHRFGHIARSCKLPYRCVNCAEHHSPHGVCRSRSKCVNCSGPHRASNRICPTYQHRYEVLTSQCPESQHIQGAVGPGHPQVSAGCIAASGSLAAQRNSMH